MVIVRISFALLVASTLGCHSLPPGRGKTQEDSFESGGRSRTYLIYEPPSAPRALVFVLHGGSGYATRTPRLIPDIFRIADDRALLLVFPQGVGESWNDGRTDPISTAHREQIDDAGFLEALATKLSAANRIASDRIFAVGISNGGMMSQRLACDSRLFTRIVSVAAMFPAEYQDFCAPKGPRSVLLIAGTEDPIMPYNGGDIEILRKTRGKVLSADDSILFWRKKNGCSESGHKDSIPDSAKDGTNSERETWQCSGARVGIIRVIGGGHTWPGGVQYLPESLIGRTARDFSATEAAVQWMLE